MEGFRAVLVTGSAPAAGPLALLWAAAVAVFLAGHACFWRLRKTFAGVI